MRRCYLYTCLAAATLLPACATVEGVGKDISAVGRGVSHVATEVRDEVFSPQPRRTVASAGQACDPNPELAGGNGLPPCSKDTSPVPTYLKRR